MKFITTLPDKCKDEGDLVAMEAECALDRELAKESLESFLADHEKMISKGHA